MTFYDVFLSKKVGVKEMFLIIYTVKRAALVNCLKIQKNF